MLGLMNKGGASTPQQQGGNQALAGLFRNNAQASPGMGMPGQMPQIMQPQRPEIGMPPRPQMPLQPTGIPGQASGPLFQNGRNVSPGMARAMMINQPGKMTPQIEALARNGRFRSR